MKAKKRFRHKHAIRLFVVIFIALMMLHRYHSLQLFDAVILGDVAEAKRLLRYPWTDANYKLVPVIDYADYMDWEATMRRPILYSLNQKSEAPPFYKIDFEMFTLLVENGATLTEGDLWFIVSSRPFFIVEFCFKHWPVKMKACKGLLRAAQNNEDVFKVSSLLFEQGITFKSDFTNDYGDSLDQYIEILMNEAIEQNNKELISLYKINGAKSSD